MWNWLIANSTTAAVTWLGTIGGGVGLILTYRQARAATTATRAVAQAIQNLETRIGIGELSYSYAQLELVKTLIVQQEHKAAQSVFQATKKRIADVCAVLNKDTANQGAIAMVRRNVAAVTNHLDHAASGAPAYKKAHTIKALNGISDFLANAEAKMKFVEGAQ